MKLRTDQQMEMVEWIGYARNLETEEEAIGWSHTALLGGLREFVWYDGIQIGRLSEPWQIYRAESRWTEAGERGTKQIDLPGLHVRDRIDEESSRDEVGKPVPALR